LWVYPMGPFFAAFSQKSYKKTLEKNLFCM